MWVEPYVLYRHCLKTSPLPYFKQYAGYALVLAAVWYATDRLCILVSGSAVFVFLIRFVICAVVPNLLFLVIYHRTKEFAFIKGKLLSLLKKYKGGKRE